jgi:hypothetical protein
MTTLYFDGRSNPLKTIATLRARVFSYLQAFDVQAVDLRQSSTGGWHGTYVNRLAHHGVNKGADVFSYLQAFDVQDIDLGQSSTGGWHATYLNRLAHGINKGEDGGGGLETITFETAPLTTHSSTVGTDSLFMDVDTKLSLSPSYGSDDDDESMGWVNVDDEDESMAWVRVDHSLVRAVLALGKQIGVDGDLQNKKKQ